MAVAVTEALDLRSDPISITVAERPPANLERIQKAEDVLLYLECGSLSWKMPESLLALEDVGGNIGASIRNFRVLQKVAAGNEPIPAGLDPVSHESALCLLAQHYRRTASWDRLRDVVAKMRDDSFSRRESLRLLRRNADPLAPQGWRRSDFGQPGEESVISD
jgi:hypothetical protein